jgi:hypothetical protein
MDLSDLSFGDKMSLKGKLFELQKKLKLMGIQKELEDDPEATFQPILEAGNYIVTDREVDFISNVEKAEAIRKQRLDMMKLTLSREHTESYTFSPVIATKGKYTPKKHIGHEEETYTERKLRKAKEAEAEMKALANSKKINPQSEKILRDRERKPASRVNRKTDDNIQSKKINEKSVMLIEQRFRRDMQLVFTYLDSEKVQRVCFDDIRTSVLQFPVETNHEVNTPASAEFIWSILDPDSKGFVAFAEFLNKCKLCRDKAVKDNKSIFRDFIMNMVSVLKRQGTGKDTPDHIHRDKPGFQPKIGERSVKLAMKVKEKDLHLALAEVTNTSTETAAEVATGEISVQDVKLSAYEHMLLRRKIARDKIATRLKAVEDEELRECTFMPLLVSSYKPRKGTFRDGNNSSADDASNPEGLDVSDEEGGLSVNTKSNSVFDRLYSLKDAKDVALSTIDLDSVTQSELDECTFRPAIPSFNQDVVKKKKLLPTGFSEFVERARDIRLNKEKTQEEKEDALFSFDNERYQRVKEAASSGPQPFNFQISKGGIRRPKVPR